MEAQLRALNSPGFEPELERLQTLVTQLTAEQHGLQTLVTQLTAEQRWLTEQLQETRYRALHYAEQVNLEQSSHAEVAGPLKPVLWRLTRPLHSMIAAHPRLARMLRRGFKLVWWTLTGQLLARWRQRQAMLSR